MTRTANLSFPAVPPLRLLTGENIPIVIRRSQRATRIAIRMQVTVPAVELVLPPRAPVAAGLRFLDSRRIWAAARMAQLPATVPFAPGALIPILGIPRRLAAVGRSDGSARPFQLTATTIEVTGDLAFVPRRTRHGMQTLARDMLAGKSEDQARRIGKAIGRVTIGDARTRWGSCTATRDLRYSWRLIMAPESVMDYVVAHEVAHFEQMNHSLAFWKLVAALHATYTADRAWLKTYGNGLLRYGR